MLKFDFEGGGSRELSPKTELNFTWVLEDFHNQVQIKVLQITLYKRFTKSIWFHNQVENLQMFFYILVYHPYSILCSSTVKVYSILYGQWSSTLILYFYSLIKLPYRKIATWFQPMAIFQYGYFPIHHTPVQYDDKDVKSPLEISTEWTPHGGSTSCNQDIWISTCGKFSLWWMILAHSYSAKKALCFDFIHWEWSKR